MDDRSLAHLRFFILLIVLTFVCSQSRSQSIGSVLFLDSPTHQYLRTRAPNDTAGTDSMSSMELGAVVSVLLGFVPPATISAASSSKLNGVLMPNPFDRPRHVFMLEVGLAEDLQVMVDLDGAMFGSAMMNKVIWGLGNVQIELPDKDEVSVFSLDGPEIDSSADILDQEINDFASWLGGSYVSNDVEPLNGELTISLPSGLQMILHMSKKSHKEFITNLVLLVRNIKRKMHEDMTGNFQNVAELMIGRFQGIKALQEEYGSEGIVQKGKELFLTAISKIFDSLQAGRKGQVVGVVLFSWAHSSESEKVVDVMYNSQPSPRWLEEVKNSSNSTVGPELEFVRRTLAWITGIILLISTLLGVYLLINMPLTRDTLLYSNIKLRFMLLKLDIDLVGVCGGLVYQFQQQHLATGQGYFPWAVVLPSRKTHTGKCAIPVPIINNSTADGILGAGSNDTSSNLQQLGPGSAPYLSQYSGGLFCLKSSWSSWERTFDVSGIWLASDLILARKEWLPDLHFPERDWNMHH
ncbi:hypothetical protein Nepgr_030115 [Nepenthes gracilis]|uniref:DUF7794 domain-containing protein n=1 Tax=Nepenthes gracilis TaxID=150966 RepID=A0AAD3Y3M4_NEPGR|nr:hypothetical protein Nepgr_030115 [Nepenthes gracilis]